MRRILGTAAPAALLALLVGVTGCGADEEAPDARDGTGSPTTAEPSSPTASSPTAPSPSAPSASGTPGTRAGSTVVLVSGSAAGGSSSETLTPVTTDAELAAFTAQLTSEVLVTDVRDAVARARAGLDGGGAVLATVAALGCDAPREVTHDPGSDRVEVVPAKADSAVQCLVPVTTVAVVADPTA